MVNEQALKESFYRVKDDILFLQDAVDKLMENQEKIVEHVRAIQEAQQRANVTGKAAAEA